MTDSAEEASVMEEVDIRSIFLLASEVQYSETSCSQDKTIFEEYHFGNRDVTLEHEQTEVQLCEPELPPQSDEDSDVSNEEQTTVNRKKKRKKASSDEDYSPPTITEEVQSPSSEEEDSDEELEHSDDKRSRRGKQHFQLCTECGSFTWSHKTHTCKHKKKPHACGVCGRRYANEVYLKRHMKSHTDNSEHRCVYCYATIITQQDKLAHQQIHQDQSQPYQCRHCTSSFSSLSERNKHVKSHRGPFEYKCDVCGISFRHKFSHERHVVVHTGVKPHKCPVCERSFNQEGHLKSHMRLHTGEKPYACPHCDKAFNHNVSLKSHIQRYHPSECGDREDNSCDGVVKKRDTQKLSETGPTHTDNEQRQDKVEIMLDTVVKPKFKQHTSGRPRGRPKRPAVGKRNVPGPNLQNM